MASLTRLYIDNGIQHLGGKEIISTAGWGMNTIGADGIVTITTPTSVYITQHWSKFADIDGNAYASLEAFRTAANDFFRNDSYPSGRPVKLTASFNRPANVLDYAANDHVSSVVTPVKQKETFTITGTVKAKQKETMTLSGTRTIKQKETITFTGTAPVKQKETVTVTGTSAVKQKATITLTGTVPVKQKEIITITGASGTFAISLTGGHTNLVTFDTDAAGTAAAFANVTNIAEYAASGIVLSASTNTIIFEAAVAGVPFVAPICTDGIADLHGTVDHNVANVVAGTANMTLVGGDNKLITFTTNLDTTAANFVTSWATYYDGLGITITAGTATVVFEAKVAGVPFGLTAVTTITGNLAGTSDPTTANVVNGTANVTGTGGLTKLLTYATTAAAATAAFVVSHAVAYSQVGVAVTAVDDTLVFESSTAGTAIVAPVVSAPLAGTVAGTVVHTLANVVVGTVAINGVGAARTMTLLTTPTAATLAFKTANVAAYLAAGIALTNSTNTLVLEAITAGVPFTSPTITDGAGDLAGTVAVNQVNVSIAQGLGHITLAGGITLPIAFDTTPTITATNFASVLNKATYLAQNIVLTNSGADLIFESKEDNQPFTAPLLVNSQGDLAGVVDPTVEYVPIGKGLVTGLGGLSKEMVFTTDANTTTTNFVSSHVAAYLAAGIVLTNSTNTVIFEANVAGVPMGTPVFTNTAGDLAGAIVHTVANVSIVPLSFVGNAAVSNGGGGMITLAKIEAPAKFAGQVFTLYVYNDTPTALVGDNVPFVLDVADISKRVGKITVTMDALVNSSEVSYGQDASFLPYQCASTLRTLKGVLLIGGAIVAPETAGLFTISLTVTIQS